MPTREQFERWLKNQDMKAINEMTTMDIFNLFMEEWIKEPENYNTLSQMINKVEKQLV